MMRPVAAVLLGMALCGCAKKPEQASPPPEPALPAATSALPQVAAPASSSAAASVDIPTEEDFEAEAERRITSSNLEAELDKLEKEIADR